MKHPERTTISGLPPVDPEAPAPDMTILPNGQHKDYWILSEQERAKGFVRPVRQSYTHIGIRPKYNIVELPNDEKTKFKMYETRTKALTIPRQAAMYLCREVLQLQLVEIGNAFGDYKYYENYPEGSEEYQHGLVGRYWTENQLRSGCGSTTTMSRSIAETYAREPGFYGSTFCIKCGVHLPVEQFVWSGTNERVGS